MKSLPQSKDTSHDKVDKNKLLLFCLIQFYLLLWILKTYGRNANQGTKGSTRLKMVVQGYTGYYKVPTGSTMLQWVVQGYKG